MQEARKKYREGRFEESLRAWSRALKHDSTLTEAWEGQVRCLLDLEEFREAETWVGKALGLYPGNAGLLSVKSLCLAFAGRFDEALAMSDDAIARAKDESPFLWHDRGAVLLMKGSGDTARMTFEKLLESSKEDWFWMLRIGTLYLRANKGTMAAAVLVKASEKAPDVPLLWYRLGQAYLLLKNQPKARSSFARALELEPGYKPALEAQRSLEKKLCFVATALAMDEESLRCLRGVRDRMVTRPAGRLAWSVYRTVGPPAAELLLRRPRLRRAARAALSSLVQALRCAGVIRDMEERARCGD